MSSQEAYSRLICELEEKRQRRHALALEIGHLWREEKRLLVELARSAGSAIVETLGDSTEPRT